MSIVVESIGRRSKEVKRYGSFKVDHKNLDTGIYVSRVDKVGCHELTTLDIRMVRPYKDEVISNMVLHSVEHILATELESAEEIRKLYFGPMGCQTGWYLVTDTEGPELAVKVGLALARAVTRFDEGLVPFNTEEECGNCYTLASTKEERDEVNKMLNKIRTSARTLIASKEFDVYNYL